MDDSVDILSSIVLFTTLAIALGGHAVASAHAGRALAAERVDREQPLPLLGRAPMDAVYRALLPLGRALATAGVSANAVTATSLVVACGAAVAFALGHLGLGAAIASVAALADAVDGIVARESNSSSRLGQVLDTTVDRYVDALLLGGLAVYVRHDALLLVLVLGAIVGASMVSYASSVTRELRQDAIPGGAIPIRRAHRLAYVILGAALGPIVARFAGQERRTAGLLPIFVAVIAIATIGNVSAIRRLLAAAERTAPPAPSPGPISHGGPR